MAFDTLIVNAGRMKILTALAVENRQEFVHLRKSTSLTDGNLSAHARRLHAAGLIEIEKSFRDGKPVTTFALSDEGRQRLTEHARAVMRAVDGEGRGEQTPVGVSVGGARDEDWID
jgi:DNA-binding MarR family transcriptional regulator